MPPLKQAVGLLHDFIHEVAILIKVLSPTPQKGASDPSCYLWTSAGSLQVLFHDSLGQDLYWASPSLPNASITIAWMNRTRMITRLRLASVPFIPPKWPLMIFRAAHYMLPTFPRMSCKSRGTPPFELLRRTQVNIAASRTLNIS